jgi:23S rRNA pseudouridine2457 synthase
LWFRLIPPTDFLEIRHPALDTPAVLIAFNKPYGVVSQFTLDGSPNRTLAEFGFPKDVYPIGRLDADSEGLLLLSDEPAWNERLLHPRHAHEREYWAQVERIPSPEALKKLERGVSIQGRKTLPCRAWILEPQPEVVAATPCRKNVDATPSSHLSNVVEATTPPCGEGASLPPKIPPRVPPIRFRKSVPDCWIGLELIEGKNRQVRRMTAAIGHPTLRLIRVRIGNLWLGDLAAGKWRFLTMNECGLVNF